MEKKRLLFVLVFLFMTSLKASEGVLDQKYETRISYLLPHLKQALHVEPCLPPNFLLGQQENDPDFAHGYFWGTQTTLKDYFENPEALNGCIIRAQMSKEVKQIGLDRFSSDGKTNDLTASGFTEIIERKGKWGIFPYREVHAKGPKGRHYYQLWVGLNETEGETIYFQLLYPKYLNEPTQNQKKIWKDFIQKTSFLSLSDLMVLHGKESNEKQCQKFHLTAQKRKADHQVVIFYQPLVADLDITVTKCTDNKLPSSFFKLPEMKIEMQIHEGDRQFFETQTIPYTLVDEFTFDTVLLYQKNLKKQGSCYIIHQKKCDETSYANLIK